MNSSEIRNYIFTLQDKKYLAFEKKLIPNLEPKKFIGARIPALRKLAKLLIKKNNAYDFLHDLPHKYFDEDQLHAIIISELSNYDSCINEVNYFLPFVNNWSTCDQLAPKIFRQYKNKLLEEIKNWITSNKIYIIRFGVVSLMRYFLDQDFNTKYLEMVGAIRLKEYYINMAIAWFFATALSKYYEKTLPFLEQKKLDDWVHNKTIQKAIESKLIAPEHKIYLRNLKV